MEIKSAISTKHLTIGAAASALGATAIALHLLFGPNADFNNNADAPDTTTQQNTLEAYFAEAKGYRTKEFEKERIADLREFFKEQVPYLDAESWVIEAIELAKLHESLPEDDWELMSFAREQIYARKHFGYYIQRVSETTEENARSYGYRLEFALEDIAKTHFLRPTENELFTIAHQAAADYVESAIKPNIEGLFDTVLNTTLRTLDAHSRYETQSSSEISKDNYDGEIVGIGAHVSKVDQGVLINVVIENGPAHKAGLRDGDIILSTQDTNFKDMPIEEAVSHIRGGIGTKIELEILRDDRHIGTIHVTRGVIETNPVTAKQIGNTE